MSAGRAAPVVSSGDRTHYLHTAEPLAGMPEFKHHHIVAAGSQISLLRWHARDFNADAAVLNIEHGPFMLHVDVKAEQLRLMAYAMLQCASDLDAATLPPPAAPGALVDIGTLERKPWAAPAATPAQAA